MIVAYLGSLLMMLARLTWASGSCSYDELCFYNGSCACSSSDHCRGDRSCSMYGWCKGDSNCASWDFSCDVIEKPSGHCMIDHDCFGSRTCQGVKYNYFDGM